MAYEEVIRFIEDQLAQLQSPGEAEAAVQSGVPIARYAAGMTSVDQLEGELTALGYKGIKKTRLMLAAQLKRAFDQFNDRLAIKRKQLEDKKITQGAFVTWLEESGIDAEGIALEVSRAEAGGPAEVREAVQVNLRLLQVDQVPLRPAEAAISVALRVVQAEPVSAPLSGEQPLNVALSIIGLEEEVITVPVQPVMMFIDIIGIKEE